MANLETSNASDLLLKMMQQTEDEYYFPQDGADIELYKAVRLSKDIKSELKTIESISKAEIKTLVNLYYQVQAFRKASREQIRSIEQGRSGSNKTDGNIAILDWANKNMAVIEKGIVDSLELIALSSKVGQWLYSIIGIGPVLAAGLMSYFDISKAKYATAFHSYGGLNDNNRPWLGKEKSTNIINNILDGSKTITNDHVIKIAAATQWKYEYLVNNAYDQAKDKWSKADLIKACAKVPYNRDLKTLLWKVGDQFHWNINNPNSLYGTLMSQRLTQETIKNNNGEFADQAAEKLKNFNISKSTTAYKAYSQGKLPDAHLIARAARWTEKIFVSHLFEEMYRVEYDKVPPRFYALAQLGDEHNKDIEPEIPYDLVSSNRNSKSEQEREDAIKAIYDNREAYKELKREERRKKKEAKEMQEAEEIFMEGED